MAEPFRYRMCTCGHWYIRHLTRCLTPGCPCPAYTETEAARDDG